MKMRGPMDDRIGSPCTCTEADVTSFSDGEPKTLVVTDPHCPIHGEKVMPQLRGEGAGATGDPPDTVPAVDDEPDASDDWDCCDDPDPRVHEQSARFFCNNCRTWLSDREETEDDE